MSTDKHCLGLGLADTFVAHWIRLRHLAQTIIGTRELAEDIVQEAYLKLTDAAATRTPRVPVAYCVQVVRNLAIDHRRRLATESVVFAMEDEGRDVAASRGTPEQHAIHRQNLTLVDQVLDDLPKRTRHAFELHRLSGLTQRDIGERLGISAALVNSMIRDASNALVHWRHLLVAE